MSTAAPNKGRAWSNADVALLKKLLAENTPERIMALKLGRSPAAIGAKVAALGLAAHRVGSRNRRLG